MLSRVKTFDSILAVYEGFYKLKQVNLKLKVCRGASARKLVVEEAKKLGVATVILGTSKTFHPMRSSASVAKYCARKLPKCVSVFAVDNDKVAFRREASGICSHQGKLTGSPTLIKKSLAAYKDKNLKSCECCARVLALPEEGNENENSLALVPIQEFDDVINHSTMVAKSNHSRSGWLLLRQVFLPKRHMQKSPGKNTSSFKRESRQHDCKSSCLVQPDHKQNIDQNDDSTLDGKSGAIVLFGSDNTFETPSICSDLSGLPKELLGLQEKHSSSCRLYSFQELVSATANF